ncbi:MAG: hypothetical protein WC460_00185 [Patescibacteria group bacterium]
MATNNLLVIIGENGEIAETDGSVEKETRQERKNFKAFKKELDALLRQVRNPVSFNGTMK